MKLFQRNLPIAATLAGLALATLARPVLPQDRQQDFEQRLAQAMSINDHDEAAKLVRTFQNEAVVRVDVLCSQLPAGTSDELEREIGFLNKAWRTSMKTGFVDNHYAYLSLMKPATFRERKRLRGLYIAQRNKYFENAGGEKDGSVFELAAGSFRGLADSFEQVGASYLAGEAWIFYALCYSDQNREREQADKRKMVEGYQGMLDDWGRIELHHAQYDSVKEHYDRLVAEGWEDALDDPDAPPPGAPKAASGATTTTVTMSFEPIEKLSKYERPNFFVDEMYQMWPSVYFQGKNVSASITTMERGPLILRNESSSLGFDFDRDGELDDELKLTGRLTVVEFDVNDEGPLRRGAILTATGQQQDKYQGLLVNLQPEDAQMSLFFLNAGSVVGMLGKTQIRVIDDNLDGFYGSPPKAYSYVGLSEGNYQPDMDSIVIGTSSRALPWSELTKIGDSWYRLESIDHGMQLSLTPMELDTATIELSFSGPAPAWMIIRGEGQLERCFFDLLAGGKSAIEVPAGTYHLYAGAIVKGKKQEVMKALVLPGADTEPWTLEQGTELVVELGKPFGFDFSVRQSGEAVTVIGASVTIVGSGGERYERTWNCAPRPQISVRRAGAKKGGKGEKMGAVLDLNAIAKDGNLRFTYADTWRPLDTTVNSKYEQPEVQLVEKKNKLFGKIESTWK